MNLLDRISNDLDIDNEYIINIAKNSKNHYSRYKIKKKNGGYRQIYHPSPSLKVLQYWLVDNIFNKCVISKNSYAYAKGCSIKKNAEIHKNSKHILHTDIKNFFNSIKTNHIKDVLALNKEDLKYLSLNEEDIQLIFNICLYEGHLVIGSVCAPIISNCVMYSFDIELNKEITKYGNLIYTRYADDIVISSTKYMNAAIVKLVEKILNKHGFNINFDKTRFMSTANRRKITGIIIDNNKISIGFNRHKEIKKMLYKKLKYKIGDSNKILGHLFFLKDIEPNYFNKIMIKYSHFGDVLSILKSDNKNINKFVEEAAPGKDM